jgi:hypothetical protein
MQIQQQPYFNTNTKIDSTGSIYCQKWDNVPLQNYFLQLEYIHYKKVDTTELKQQPSVEKQDSGGFVFGYDDFILLILLGMFALLTYIRISGRNYFNRLFMSVINYSYAISFFREKNLSFVLYNNFMMIILYVCLGMQLIEIFGFFDVPLPPYDPKLLLLLFSLAVACLIFLNRLLIHFAGFLFGASKVASEFVFYLFSLLKVSALAYLVLCVLISFVHRNSEPVFIYLSLIIAFFIYFIKLIRIFIIFFRNRFSLYYLILYLCALEIIPVLLFIRVLRQFINNGYTI